MMNPISGVTPTESRVAAALGNDAVAAADSFGEVFAQVASNARDTMRAGEAAAIKGVNGDSSVQDVVQALMSAEEQLRAAVAVRDRVVAAYQEIARMQI